jgi:hypothetical protein
MDPMSPPFELPPLQAFCGPAAVTPRALERLRTRWLQEVAELPVLDTDDRALDARREDAR